MEEKARKLNDVRMILTLIGVGIIVVGVFLALFYGKVTFIPFGYESLMFLILGVCIFIVGVLVLIISQCVINGMLGKLRELRDKEEKRKHPDSEKLNKFQKSKKIREEYKNRKK